MNEKYKDDDGRFWERVEWPFANMPDRVTWRTRLRHAVIYLNDEQYYPFTVDAGANSDYSYSGALYGSGVEEIEDAMLLCIASVKRTNRWEDDVDIHRQ